jgi:hypothetical protein
VWGTNINSRHLRGQIENFIRTFRYAGGTQEISPARSFPEHHHSAGVDLRRSQESLFSPDVMARAPAGLSVQTQ